MTIRKMICFLYRTCSGEMRARDINIRTVDKMERYFAEGPFEKVTTSIRSPS